MIAMSVSVDLSGCLTVLEHILEIASPELQLIFSACCLCPWLDQSSCGGVGDTLCISGFADDVVVLAYSLPAKRGASMVRALSDTPGGDTGQLISD